MGQALIVDAATVETTAASTLYAATAGSGSTLTVRNAALTSQVLLTDVWRRAVTTAGQVQITSPKIVPISHGIQFNLPAGTAGYNMPGPPYQVLTPQDNLTMQLSGGATEKVVGLLQSYYSELPGIEMTLKNLSEIEPQTEFVFGWEVDITTSATVGAQNETVVTTTYDGSTANAWYALLGYAVSAPIAAVGIKGIDTSATFIGGPAEATGRNTSRYFADLSMRSGKPCIPMWNAANKGNTFVVGVDAAASTATKVTLILAQMQGSFTP